MGYPFFALLCWQKDCTIGTVLHVNKMALMERCHNMNSDDESTSRTDFGASRRLCSMPQLFARVVKEEKEQPS